MRLIAKIGDWFDARLQLAAPIREAVEHPVPKNTASWWYVFGSAALVGVRAAVRHRDSAGPSSTCHRQTRRGAVSRRSTTT
jgi:hypothetical protein